MIQEVSFFSRNSKILRTILNEERAQANEPEDKKVDDDAHTLHLRDDMDRLYVLRKEGERGVASIEDGLDASIQGLEDYIKKNKEKLITAASNSSDNIRTNRTVIT